MIGNFFRAGKLFTQERITVHDHDFRSLAEGMAIPHGLYDVFRNIGYVTIGTSRDTTEFACACIRYWWLNYGSILTPLPSFCFVTVAGATMPGITSSSKTYSNSLTNWALLSGWHTILLIHRNTILSSIACFLISLGPARALSSSMSNWSKN